MREPLGSENDPRSAPESLAPAATRFLLDPPAILTGVQVVGPARVYLFFADGAGGEIDFAPLVARGGVFSRLSDPVVFSRVKIAENGRALAWPGDLDFCADALWLEVSGRSRPITGEP